MSVNKGEELMSYTLDQFCEDCRSAITADDGDASRETIRQKLENLLANEEFVAANCGPGAERGIHTLYEDPKLGFVVLAHIYDKGVESPPHDHGPSWAVYGQSVEHTDMTIWTETGTDGDNPIVEPAESYRLDPGMAETFNPRRVHSIKFPAGARFVRVTGTDLNTVAQRRFDLANNKIDHSKPVPRPS